MESSMSRNAVVARKFRAFMRWMQDNGLEYSDGVSFELGGRNSVADVGVKAVTDMKEGDIIATIPKHACLTAKTTSASTLLEEAKLGGCLALAVAVMYERRLQEGSKWFGYLQSLPNIMNLPILWTVEQIDELLIGTELHEVIKQDKLLVEDDWDEFVVALTKSNPKEFPPKWFTFNEYLGAKTLVSSRAFEVDNYHGFGMVPLADLFNHKTGDEDVHFTNVTLDSDDEDEESDVPAAEGKTRGDIEKNFSCVKEEKSRNIGNSGTSEFANGNAEGDNPKTNENEILEMILVKDVSKGSEVFNTYGSLSNAALLHRYGFTEMDNPFDIVNVDLTLVLESLHRRFTPRHVRRRLNQWRKVCSSPDSIQDPEYFEFSADGKPEVALVMLVFMMSLSDELFDILIQKSDGAESAFTVQSVACILGWEDPDSSLDHQTKMGKRKSHNMDKKQSARELTSWLLTASVCKCLLEVLKLRDARYPSKSLEEDESLLEVTNMTAKPERFHALRLRISERLILRKVERYISNQLTSIGDSSNGYNMSRDRATKQSSKVTKPIKPTPRS